MKLLLRRGLEPVAEMSSPDPFVGVPDTGQYLRRPGGQPVLTSVVTGADTEV
jgi:hypothetical protein